MKKIPYAHQSINAEDIEAVTQTLKTDFITRGPKVEEFEQAFAAYCNAKFAVVFNSGTSALQAAYFSANLNSFDKLLTTPNTFVATVGAALLQKTQPVFIDIDRRSGNLNLEQLKFNLEDSRSTRGRQVIAPVHFAGIAMDVEKIDNMIQDPDAVIIEDAAHALGSYYPNGEKVGSCSHSHMTIFSFHPAKTMTTGEGGAVTTNDEELAYRLRLFRNNGIERNPQLWRSETEGKPWYYEVKEVTGNYHLTEPQAALGLSQLKRIDKFVSRRSSLVKLYRNLLKDFEGITLFDSEVDRRTAFHLFVVQIDFERFGTTREEVMLKLQEKGIGTQVHYIPVYKHPFFEGKKESIAPYFPEMEKYYREALSLPLYYDLSDADVEFVVEELKKTLKGR